MKNSAGRGNEMKKVVLGSVAAIAVCAMVFGGISQTVKAAEIGKTQVVPTTYNLPYTAPASNTPSDYVKKDYKVKLIGKDQPTQNDMKMEEAAELASQNLWRIYGVDLSGRTVEMTYEPISKIKLRATWNADVKINDDLSYSIAVDAITGENHSAAKWIYHNAKIPEGMDIKLLKNNEEYQSLAKAAAEKYQLVAGKVASVEYSGQGYSTNRKGNKNSDISFHVTSDKGEVAQVSFSRYNKELLNMEYASWIKETEHWLKVTDEENKDQSVTFMGNESTDKENAVPKLQSK
ncbi:hypothetical protein P4H66_00235 [Paenibacillus dokdonensis]|uniref:Uncharacterized protein n=1 Tax=Paenibacillus dokdonensis TaxID=2567944 RepID=A0ABU6GJE6_9BACL|nr:hypothetical protein [Paenibacillus dokdonensis]MEC0238297.1 hypothetical protein [Paenibacillus dokdonensis]